MYQTNPREESGASTKGGDLKSRAAEIGQSAADASDQARLKAAGGLDATARAVHQSAESLPGGTRVAGAAHSAADALQTGATYLREHDFPSMVDDVMEIVKRNPGPALLGAAALGFVVGRAFMRD